MSFRRLGPGLLAALALAGATPASAQHVEDPGTALSRHLRDLSDNPQSVQSLLGAGRAALALGDAQAAATFFGRAEEIAPRDSRAKAGLGASFTQLHQPNVALKFFSEAASLGAAERDIAGDRGLAYDTIGDSRRAQRDYRAALQTKEDDEIRRRLALSLAISGDRAGAEAALDAQLRRQDRAAWRTRAFVLALVGDSSGAATAASAVMAPAQASALRPFFTRLSALNPAQKAMAVHFGEFPSDGRAVQMAQRFDTAPPVSASPLAADRIKGTLASEPGTLQPRTAPLATVSTASRRRPGETSGPQLADAGAGRIGPGMRPDLHIRRPVGGSAQRAPTAQPLQTASAAPVPVAPSRQAPQPVTTVASRAVDLLPRTITPAPSSIAPAALPPSTVAQVQPRPISLLPEDPVAERIAVVPSAPATTSPIAQARPGFAGLAASIATLSADTPPPPASAPVRAPPPAAKPKPLATAAKADPAPPKKKPAAKKPEPAKPKEPSRHWVQIAGGANKAVLPREYARLKEKAPKLLGTRGAWTTPLKATNRLLVGPFKSEAEAQGFVNDLAKASLSAFSWTSEDGQEIEKLPLK